jgi:hypothetical protein
MSAFSSGGEVRLKYLLDLQSFLFPPCLALLVFVRKAITSKPIVVPPLALALALVSTHA